MFKTSYPFANPVDGIIFEDFARTRMASATDHRESRDSTFKLTRLYGGSHGPTDIQLRGHPTRADARLKRF